MYACARMALTGEWSKRVVCQVRRSRLTKRRSERSEEACHVSEAKVFISHSNRDHELVRSAKRWLRGSDLSGAQIIDDAALASSGEDMRKLIVGKIREADVMVLVWSARAPGSAWVQYELGVADALEVPVRVLLAGGTRKKLPSSLASAEAVELNNSHRLSEAGRKRLVLALKKRLATKRAAGNSVPKPPSQNSRDEGQLIEGTEPAKEKKPVRTRAAG